MKRISGLLVLWVLTVAWPCPTFGLDPVEGYARVERSLANGPVHRMVLVPEGCFVAAFNERVERWIRRPFDASLVRQIRLSLGSNLKVSLDRKGFAQAATRDSAGAKDETNYDAIWVRDSVWVWYALVADPERNADARRLILALWDYYASAAQVARFEAVIREPAKKGDPMAMPHIRFDASSPTLADVQVGGRPEVWNHRQMDAHGLFFAALGEALETGLIGEAELTPARARVLGLYPLFVRAVDFTTYEDAGAWEELPRRNTSSIGLVTRSLQVWKRLVLGPAGPSIEPVKRRLNEAIARSIGAKEWEPAALDRQIAAGLATVKRQLALGGESPGYEPGDPHFRRADAALLALLVPRPLQGLSDAEKRAVVTIVETLVRPYGVLRYENDSYQCGNYWVRPPGDVPASGGPAPTGDTSSREAFLWRLSKLTPHTEAEWFFDSLLALARLHLATTATDARARSIDVCRAVVHTKRALGQLTGENALAADGASVRAMQPPESVNHVLIRGARHSLPSPITPLNWAKAALGLALSGLEKTLAR